MPAPLQFHIVDVVGQRLDPKAAAKSRYSVTVEFKTLERLTVEIPAAAYNRDGVAAAVKAALAARGDWTFDDILLPV